MKFMTMVKSVETSEPPPMALMVAIAKLGEDAAKAGIKVESGGLLPTELGASFRLEGGNVVSTDGPFSEAKEVVGGFAIYEVRSREEVME